MRARLSFIVIFINVARFHILLGRCKFYDFAVDLNVILKLFSGFHKNNNYDSCISVRK